MLSRRCFVTTSASAGLACALGGSATTTCAQTLAKNARLLVGFPPGGSLDVVARLLVEHMKGYAPSMIVDNRPGAGGRIALEALKAGEPDGSLLALTPGDQVTLFPHVYKRPTYDALRDFVPVTTVCTFPFLLAVGPIVPANVSTLAQFIDWCRANPRLATYGSPGVGTRPHFLGVTLARAAGFKFVHLPYKGGAHAIQDVLGGQIPAIISVFSNVYPHVQSGSMRALAITAPQRSPLLPNVPTAREAGYPGMEAVEWFGLFVPAKTPADIVNFLHSSVQLALQTEPVKSGLARHSFDAVAISRTDFVALIRADTERWGEIVKASSFKPIE
ncbi:MAG: Bug family tripartite tricarboxylate transporter substrate binding protein [Hyphomicrobiaceae bacterium]